MSGRRRLGFAALVQASLMLPGLVAAVQPGAVLAAPAGPCLLLTDTEVRAIFPDAETIKLDRRLQAEGILTCYWDYPGGRFSIQTYGDVGQSIEAETRGMTMFFVDPLNPRASAAVRYVPVKGIGDAAMAFVERKDAAKGFLSDMAVLVVHRGKLQAMLTSTDLARKERPVALQALEQLGGPVSQRLDTAAVTAPQTK